MIPADVLEFITVQRGDRKVVRLTDGESGLSARTIQRRLNRFARARAAELGNPDPSVVLMGFSAGGGQVAHAALFGAALEERWDEFADAMGDPQREVECLADGGSTHVDAVIGTGGTYDFYVPIYDGRFGRAFQQEIAPEVQKFLASAVGVNPDLKVGLLHSTSDPIVPLESSEE